MESVKDVRGDGTITGMEAAMLMSLCVCLTVVVVVIVLDLLLHLSVHVFRDLAASHHHLRSSCWHVSSAGISSLYMILASGIRSS